LGSCATFTILGRILLGLLGFDLVVCAMVLFFFVFFSSSFGGELLVHFQLACLQASKCKILCISMDFGFSWFTCEIRNCFFFFFGQVWFHIFKYVGSTLKDIKHD